MEILVQGDEREVMSFHGVITQLIFYLNFLNLCFSFYLFIFGTSFSVIIGCSWGYFWLLMLGFFFFC